MPLLTGRGTAIFCLALAFCAVPARTVLAQATPDAPEATSDSTAAAVVTVDSDRATDPTITFSGVAYIEYAYTLDSPTPEASGANSFDYRRVYLTADSRISEDFRARFRLEARGASTTAAGRPVPFVKDAYVRWDGPFADGHRLTLGVQPPPLFETSEGFWGYRSLEATVIDRTKANDSRDMGLRADGPLAGPVDYSVMVANGQGLRPEDGLERGKHVYGQLRIQPSDALVVSMGADFTPHEGKTEIRDETVKVSGFVGARGRSVRVGVEAFYSSTNYMDSVREGDSGVGLSTFAVYTFGDGDPYRLIGRYDYVEGGVRRILSDESYALVAFSYAPTPRVEIMPNVVYSSFGDADPTVTARLTVYARF